MNTKKALDITKVIVLGIILSASLTYATGTWTAPTLPPPQGNVDAPINTSANLQTKLGALSLGSSVAAGSASLSVTGATLLDSLAVSGATILNGTVKIGNPTQGQVLVADANGNAAWGNSSGSNVTTNTNGAGCPQADKGYNGYMYGQAWGFNDDGAGNDLYLCCKDSKVVYFGHGGRSYSGQYCDEFGNVSLDPSKVAYVGSASVSTSGVTCSISSNSSGKMNFAFSGSPTQGGGSSYTYKIIGLKSGSSPFSIAISATQFGSGLYQSSYASSLVDASGAKLEVTALNSVSSVSCN